MDEKPHEIDDDEGIPLENSDVLAPEAAAAAVPLGGVSALAAEAFAPVAACGALTSRVGLGRRCSGEEERER